MNPSVLTAISTRYAGCHFRSRLEARWAVFFDALGIAWEYEPEGFMCEWRLNPYEDRGEVFPYLPDFRLPNHNLWVEVKGTLTHDQCLRLLNAAAYLGAPGGGCNDGNGNVLVLGPVPNPTWGVAPVALHMHKGSLYGYAWTGQRARCEYGSELACDSSDGDGAAVVEYVNISVGTVIAALLGGSGYLAVVDALQRGQFLRMQEPSLSDRWKAALRAARSARFEHGQNGAL